MQDPDYKRKKSEKKLVDPNTVSAVKKIVERQTPLNANETVRLEESAPNKSSVRVESLQQTVPNTPTERTLGANCISMQSQMKYSD